MENIQSIQTTSSKVQAETTRGIDKSEISNMFEKLENFNLVEFFYISNPKTKKLWEELIENRNEESVSRFVSSITTDDFMKIISKMLSHNKEEGLHDVERFILLSFCSNIISTEVYGVLMDLCHYKYYFLNSIKRNNVNERELVKILAGNFDVIFPEYELIKTEYIVNGVGRIDILAKDLYNDSYVIIECKRKRHNPTKQLLAYATSFHSPVLIGITEEVLSIKARHEGIIYLTYEEVFGRVYEHLLKEC